MDVIGTLYVRKPSPCANHAAAPRTRRHLQHVCRLHFFQHSTPTPVSFSTARLPLFLSDSSRKNVREMRLILMGENPEVRFFRLCALSQNRPAKLVVRFFQLTLFTKVTHEI